MKLQPKLVKSHTENGRPVAEDPGARDWGDSERGGESGMQTAGVSRTAIPEFV